MPIYHIPTSVNELLGRCLPQIPLAVIFISIHCLLRVASVSPGPEFETPVQLNAYCLTSNV